ncbi:MAG: Trk system potassium transporter TrkA [Clostridia bacterium]|nr:Trk system potassium transporter TrkA [Clostridia bacterium]
MKILVVGCGKIGTTIIDSLSAEGHDVTAIDRIPSVLEEITNIYDVMGVCGNGADHDVLKEAGVENADLFVAVTDSDDNNMLSCFLARRLGARHTIARIRNPEYNDQSLGFLKKNLGLSMAINPEQMAAQELHDLLKFPSAVKVETFSQRNFEMIEFKLRENSALDGLRLSEMRTQYKGKFLVCGVERGTEVYIPDGSFVLKSGDKIILTATPSELQKLLRELGVLQKKARRVMILGGSRTAFYLARLLETAGNSVTLIEKDAALAQELSAQLTKTVVIRGDGSQQELLLEEDITAQDALVALTGMDEENILMSIFAASQNVPKVIAKINRDELAQLAESLGLESIVSPRKIVSDVLVRYARALQNSMGSSMETLYQLMDGKAEALEFLVRDEPGVVGIPLKDLNIKPNTLIGGIVRDRKTLIPTGNDMILSGDRVVVLAANQRLHDLSDILK